MAWTAAYAIAAILTFGVLLYVAMAGSFQPTEEARALARILRDAGLEQDEEENAYRLEYQFDVPDLPAVRGTVQLFFEPYLPHGEFLLCSPCR